jgi:hypothetical protein
VKGERRRKKEEGVKEEEEEDDIERKIKRGSLRLLLPCINIP